MTARYPSLVGKSVFISGGATGIGAALSKAFAGQGARVGFVDIAEAAGMALASQLNDAGGMVTFKPCDITDTAAYRAAIADIEAIQGPIQVLVNNAANDMRHDWRDVTPESYDATLSVNLRHQFFAIQAVAPGMIAAGGGSIINFGSISWMNKAGGMPVYTSSKAAVHGMTVSIR
jgi:NAD(P)-dependent dehydrogenase (short-subunit alcohol dehydrogenase family)